MSEADATLLSDSVRTALETGTWSVADIALIDDLAARLGAPRTTDREERGFYEVEEVDGFAGQRDDDASTAGTSGGAMTGGTTGGAQESTSIGYQLTPHTMRERLMSGRLEQPAEYAHVLIDEAQDVSPMQWRMLGRRGRWSSWTVVGDAAQASWPDAAEAGQAREQAFGSQVRSLFHMDTNYRNAREIFDYAAGVIRDLVPDADLPLAVRETGVSPIVTSVTGEQIPAAVADAVEQLLGEVEGSIAVICPGRWIDSLRPGTSPGSASVASARVHVVDPMSTKGLEYDATVIVDPVEITAESPGGIRILYVALTRAAHRMTVLEVSE
jgi:DNA helicase IV